MKESKQNEEYEEQKRKEKEKIGKKKIYNPEKCENCKRKRIKEKDERKIKKNRRKGKIQPE